MTDRKTGKNTKRVTVEGLTLPANYEAERSLLGAVIFDNDICFDVTQAVTPEDFYTPSHRCIYEAVKQIYDEGKPIDLVTLSDKLEAQNRLLEAGGLQYINDITDSVLSAVNYRHYLEIVLQNSLRRKIIRTSKEIIEDTYEINDGTAALNSAEEKIFAIGKGRETSDLVHVKEPILSVINKFEGISQNDSAYQGLKSGFDLLDNITKGFLGGQLIVLAARPGCGKTSYAMNIAGHIALSHPEKKVAVFSLEMSKEELTQRLVCSLAQVPMTTMLSGTGQAEEFRKIFEVQKQLNSSNVYIDDTANLTSADVLSKCRRLAQQKKGIDFVVIDYLQLMGSDIQRDSKQYEVSDISRSMKILAKELNVPILLLSQMNRAFEKRQGEDKRPQLSDLRDSGAIEQDADMVFFLNPLNIKPGAGAQYKYVELVIAKHRNGPTGELNYKFFGDMVRFREVVFKKRDELLAMGDDAVSESELLDE